MAFILSLLIPTDVIDTTLVTASSELRRIHRALGLSSQMDNLWPQMHRSFQPSNPF